MIVNDKAKDILNWHLKIFLLIDLAVTSFAIFLLLMFYFWAITSPKIIFYPPSSRISSFCVRTVDTVMCLHTWRSPVLGSHALTLSCLVSFVSRYHKTSSPFYLKTMPCLIMYINNILLMQWFIILYSVPKYILVK